jgi:hypothetical protein
VGPTDISAHGPQEEDSLDTPRFEAGLHDQMGLTSTGKPTNYLLVASALLTGPNRRERRRAGKP